MRNTQLFGYQLCCFAHWDDEQETDYSLRAAGDDDPTQIPGGGGSISEYEDSDPTLVKNQITRFHDHREDDEITEIEFLESGPLGLLWVLTGDRRGKIYLIKDGDIIGKKDGDIYLDDPKVSTIHCRLREEKNKLVLWDCGSKNGTFVNNKRIRCATTLEENDIVKIGDVQFIYKFMS
jgi:hypothetical protein